MGPAGRIMRTLALLGECLGGVIVVSLASVCVLALLGELLAVPPGLIPYADNAAGTMLGLFFFACFAVLGASLSFLVADCFFPQGARLPLAWRLSAWVLAVPVTVALYLATGYLFEWVLFSGIRPP